jgi:hypothetical protein
MTERTEVLRSTLLPAAALLRFDAEEGGWLDRPARPVLVAAAGLSARELEVTSVVSSP